MIVYYLIIINFYLPLEPDEELDELPPEDEELDEPPLEEPPEELEPPLELEPLLGAL